jgi:hypothetical protein
MTKFFLTGFVSCVGCVTSTTDFYIHLENDECVVTGQDTTMLNFRGRSHILGKYGYMFLLSWYRDSFPGVKRLGGDVDHSPPYSAKVKNEWSYTATPPIWLLGLYRDNF